MSVLPSLDFANPLHTFSAGNLSYTATEECYICGSLTGNSTGVILFINSQKIANGQIISSYVVTDMYISPLRISAGDVVSVDHVSDYLKVYRAK